MELFDFNLCDCKVSDLTLSTTLFVTTLIGEFFLLKRISYLKSDEAIAKFTESEIKNGKSLLYIFVIVGIPIIALAIYRTVIAL